MASTPLAIPRVADVRAQPAPAAAAPRHLSLRRAGAALLCGAGLGLLADRGLLAAFVAAGWFVRSAPDAGLLGLSASVMPWLLTGVGVALAAPDALTRPVPFSRACAALLVVTAGVVLLGSGEVRHHVLGWVRPAPGRLSAVSEVLFHVPGFALVAVGRQLARGRAGCRNANGAPTGAVR